MWKYILLALGLISYTSINAQTTVFSEDFETGGTTFDLNTSDEGGVNAAAGANQWIVNGIYGLGFGTSPCTFSDMFIDAVATQPAGISSAGGQYMHIYSDEAAGGWTGGPATFNCNYMTASTGCSGAQSYFAAMNTDISTVGKTDVTLNFWWLCEGSAVGFGEVYYKLSQTTNNPLVGSCSCEH